MKGHEELKPYQLLFFKCKQKTTKVLLIFFKYSLQFLI